MTRNDSKLLLNNPLIFIPRSPVKARSLLACQMHLFRKKIKIFSLLAFGMTTEYLECDISTERTCPEK